MTLSPHNYSDRKFTAADMQNASLSGGVVVGAVCNLLLQPYGAVLAGSVVGIVSTFGYQVVQGVLQDLFNLHDSCGVNNLHGMPGIMGGILSAIMASIAKKADYGIR